MSQVIGQVWREVVGCRNWPVMRVPQFIALQTNEVCTFWYFAIVFVVSLNKVQNMCIAGPVKYGSTGWQKLVHHVCRSVKIGYVRFYINETLDWSQLYIKRLLTIIAWINMAFFLALFFNTTKSLPYVWYQKILPINTTLTLAVGWTWANELFGKESEGGWGVLVMTRTQLRHNNQDMNYR